MYFTFCYCSNPGKKATYCATRTPVCHKKVFQTFKYIRSVTLSHTGTPEFWKRTLRREAGASVAWQSVLQCDLVTMRLQVWAQAVSDRASNLSKITNSFIQVRSLWWPKQKGTAEKEGIKIFGETLFVQKLMQHAPDHASICDEFEVKTAWTDIYFCLWMSCAKRHCLNLINV